jgi:hypothetical protein
VRVGEKVLNTRPLHGHGVFLADVFAEDIRCPAAQERETSDEYEKGYTIHIRFVAGLCPLSDRNVALPWRSGPATIGGHRKERG